MDPAPTVWYLRAIPLNPCLFARKSLGIAVASGMLASTCLAVLFVPAFFVVIQRFAERKKNRRPEDEA